MPKLKDVAKKYRQTKKKIPAAMLKQHAKQVPMMKPMLNPPVQRGKHA